MGLIDSIKDALGGERDENAGAAEPFSAPAGEPFEARKLAPREPPRHVDRDAPAESVYGPQITGGKHALRD